MTKCFVTKANASFIIGDTDQTITVKGVEFIYPYGADRDTYAISAVGIYIRQNIQELTNQMLRLVWVETGKSA